MDENNTNNNSSSQTPSTSPAAAPQAPAEAQDMSKTTVAILVLLTLMISIIGTWTVLNEISAVKMAAAPPMPSTSQGKVQLVIGSPDGDGSSMSAATGRVTFEVTDT
jgi:hypothetical protein